MRIPKDHPYRRAAEATLRPGSPVTVLRRERKGDFGIRAAEAEDFPVGVVRSVEPLPDGSFLVKMDLALERLPRASRKRAWGILGKA